MPPTCDDAHAAGSWVGRRVLVTGGAGFLGSHLVRRLAALGAQVSVVAGATSGLEKIVDCLDRLTVLRGDLASRSDVVRVVQHAQPHIIFHLAAAGVSPLRADADKMVTTNVLGLVHLLEALADIPYTRFVNTGTCFEYGNQPGPLSEEHPLMPLNTYAASKIMAWHLCQLHAKQTGKPVVTLRLFTFFGPGERPDRLIPSTIRSALRGEAIRITSGAQTRDYTYVEDVVDAYLRAAVREQAVGHTFNIGSGRDYSVREIAQRVRDVMRSDVPIHAGALQTRADEAWRLCCDASKARELLGWRPRLTFDEGLRRTIDWMAQSTAQETVAAPAAPVEAAVPQHGGGRGR